jgi:hypothetical protein
LDFGFWMLDGRWKMEDEDQERDAPATLEEGVSEWRFWILSFKFWMEGPAPDDSVGLPFARFPRR